jgi:hypothetical protein
MRGEAVLAPNNPREHCKEPVHELLFRFTARAQIERESNGRLLRTITRNRLLRTGTDPLRIGPCLF